jgi:hypothetical protein
MRMPLTNMIDKEKLAKHIKAEISRQDQKCAMESPSETTGAYEALAELLALIEG